MAKGCWRSRRACSKQAQLRTLEEAQSTTQTSPGSHPVFVTACNVCVDCANSVEGYAHQITPLKRLRVGKGSPAKRRHLEACCLLTCNASRGSASCSGPCFVFYKGCCLLQHILSAHHALLHCWRGHLAHHLSAAKELTCLSQHRSRCSPQGDPANCRTNLLRRISTGANGLFSSAN